VLLTLTTLLVFACGTLLPQWHGNATSALFGSVSAGSRSIEDTHSSAPAANQQQHQRRKPGPTIEAYVRPDFARLIRKLRPVIFEAAQRHNREELSGMSDDEFAMVMALLMYNEHFGQLEEQVKPLRALTPIYEDLQVQANSTGVANLSVWPSNLRPSVALEILKDRVPIPGPTKALTVPLEIYGSRIDLSKVIAQNDLYAAISEEIADPELAVEYLAANLERGVYRAHYEGVPVTWRALAAWHNQGIVAARDIRKNPVAASYVHRTSSYLPAARRFIETPTECRYHRCTLELGPAFEVGWLEGR
jgi:hypothetical protein